MLQEVVRHLVLGFSVSAPTSVPIRSARQTHQVLRSPFVRLDVVVASNIGRHLREACEPLALSNSLNTEDGCRTVDRKRSWRRCRALMKLVYSSTCHAMLRKGNCHRTVTRHIGAMSGHTEYCWTSSSVLVDRTSESAREVVQGQQQTVVGATQSSNRSYGKKFWKI